MSDRLSSPPPSAPSLQGSPAFALVSTLLIIAVLTIMVVAFMQSMRVDRLTAKSYLDKYKADLAARSAVNQAVLQIQSAMIIDTNTGKMDLSYTTELVPDPNTNILVYSPITAIGSYTTNATGVVRKLTALVSSPTNVLSYSTNVSIYNTNPTIMVNPSNGTYSNFSSILFNARRVAANTMDLNSEEEIQVGTTLATGTDKTNYFRVAYLPITNSVGLVTERYAFAVFDEQARINPKFHRSADRDNFGTNAAEIPVSVGTATNGLLIPSEETLFKAATNLPASPESIAPFFSSADRAHAKKQFFGYYDVVNQDVIPATYADGGKPKYNIRDLSTNSTYGTNDTARAENIATIIDRNLPNFKQRDPSFDTATNTANNIKYVRRLAASIVDYADPTSTGTAVNGGEPAGKGLYPMVIGIGENFKWISKGTDPTYNCTFETQYYLEIWNPYTYPVTGDIRLEVLKRMTLRVGNAIPRTLKDYDKSAPDKVTVRPNELLVVEFPSQAEDTRIANKDPDSVDPAATTAATMHPWRPIWNATNGSDSSKEPHPYFKLYWNGKLVDMNRREFPDAPATSGLVRGAIVTTESNANRPKIGQNRWSLNFAQTPDSPTSGKRRVIDPRINFISNYDWPENINSNYPSGTKWGGRPDAATVGMDLVASLKPRDFVRLNPNLGGAPSGITQTPADAALHNGTPYVEATDKLNAPFYASTNSIQSIGELGNIFDPSQAADDGTSSPKLASDGTGVGPYGAGGGRSLRIGQPEFSTLDAAKTWDVKGKRAMELLDLFSVNPIPSANGYPEFKGRININTASSEVLRALFYNIKIKSDKGAYSNPDGSENTSRLSVIAETQAKDLAEAIVKDRAVNGPYTRTSDLYRIFALTNVTTPTALVWNAAGAYAPQLGAGAINSPPEVMDRAREELFTKMVNLVDTQSRAFRIYSSGQALGPTGKVTARSFLESIVVFEPSTQPSGDVILVPRVIYEKFY